MNVRVIYASRSRRGTREIFMQVISHVRLGLLLWHTVRDHWPVISAKNVTTLSISGMTVARHCLHERAKFLLLDRCNVL